MKYITIVLVAIMWFFVGVRTVLYKEFDFEPVALCISIIISTAMLVLALALVKENKL